MGRVPKTPLQVASASEINSSMRNDSSCNFTSPASSRAISPASPTRRFSRSHSSLMMFKSSVLCTSSSLVPERRLVTEAFMDVRGVRKSCVIASSRADFRRSPSRAASVFPTSSIACALSTATAIRVPSASSDCLESTGPEIPTLPRIRVPMRSGAKQTLCSSSIWRSSRAIIAFKESASSCGRFIPERYIFCLSTRNNAAAPTSNISTIWRGIAFNNSMGFPAVNRRWLNL